MKKEWQEERKKKEREKNKTKGRKMEENTDRKTDKRLDGQSNYVKIMFTCFWVFVVISVSRVFLAKCFDISANWSKQGKYHYKEIGIKRNQPLPCDPAFRDVPTFHSEQQQEQPTTTTRTATIIWKWQMGKKGVCDTFASIHLKVFFHNAKPLRENKIALYLSPSMPDGW